MVNGSDLYELAKIQGHSNIKTTERYAKLAGQHIARITTARELWKLFERATPKVNVRDRMFAYCSREKFLHTFLAIAKLLKGLVARDGIEPPTPAFSGPPTESRKWFEINGSC